MGYQALIKRIFIIIIHRANEIQSIDEMATLSHHPFPYHARYSSCSSPLNQQ
jgi:hypothetical protein